MTPETWVVSDLHLGGGTSDPLEDFTVDRSLVGFIDELASVKASLVVNGDFLEFAQVGPHLLPDDLRDLPSHLLWTSALSTQKAASIVAAHGTVFDALGRICQAGGEVTIAVGNHDLDLAFPEVQAILRDAIGGSSRLRFTLEPVQVDDVWIEHGHAATPENCPTNPISFIHEHEWRGVQELFLERVWGTDFLIRWYNDFERAHPYADNVKPMAAAVFHGVRAKPRLIKLRDFVSLLAFLARRGLPPGGIGAVLDGEVEANYTDVAAHLAGTRWESLAVELLPDEIDEAIAELPRDLRIALAQPETTRLPDPDEMYTDPAALLGGDRREKPFAEALLGRPGVRRVVLGHTHREIDGDLGGALFNPGTWIPRLHLDDPDVKREIDRIGFSSELLQNADLYVHRLRAIRIRAGIAESTVQLVTIDDVG